MYIYVHVLQWVATRRHSPREQLTRRFIYESLRWVITHESWLMTHDSYMRIHYIRSICCSVLQCAAVTLCTQPSYFYVYIRICIYIKLVAMCCNELLFSALTNEWIFCSETACKQVYKQLIAFLSHDFYIHMHIREYWRNIFSLYSTLIF